MYTHTNKHTIHTRMYTIYIYIFILENNILSGTYSLRFL